MGFQFFGQTRDPSQSTRWVGGVSGRPDKDPPAQGGFVTGSLNLLNQHSFSLLRLFLRHGFTFDFSPLSVVPKVRRQSHACAHDFAICVVPFALSNSIVGPSVLENSRSHNTGTEAGASLPPHMWGQLPFLKFNQTSQSKCPQSTGPVSKWSAILSSSNSLKVSFNSLRHSFKLPITFKVLHRGVALSEQRVNTAKEKIHRVFSYIRELTKLRTPPVSEVSTYEWSVRFSALPRYPTVQTSQILDQSEEEFDGVILRVKRPKWSECRAQRR